jgi:hypothetical protein
MKIEFALILITVLMLSFFPALVLHSFPKFMSVELKLSTLGQLGTISCSRISPQEPSSGGGGQGVT